MTLYVSLVITTIDDSINENASLWKSDSNSCEQKLRLEEFSCYWAALFASSLGKIDLKSRK